MTLKTLRPLTAVAVAAAALAAAATSAPAEPGPQIAKFMVSVHATQDISWQIPYHFIGGNCDAKTYQAGAVTASMPL